MSGKDQMCIVKVKLLKWCNPNILSEIMRKKIKGGDSPVVQYPNEPTLIYSH